MSNHSYSWYICKVQTQTVWMIVILPPDYQELFIEHNKLVRPCIVRESTNRLNIRYITKELVAELADLLGCALYTADFSMEEEKRAVIKQWLSTIDPPAVIAISALGPGFNHPRVQWVIHVGAPSLMINFSQELGRAGRDGKVAESIVLLSATWQLQLDRQLGADQEAMWCMEGDELYGVCPNYYTERRPPDLEFYLLRLQAEEVASEGEGEYRYERDLEIMMGCCLYCRVEGKPFEHAAAARGKEWMDLYAVCWMCYQLQEICQAADPEYKGDITCRFPDIVMPLYFRAFSYPGRTKWFLKHFN
ncbi:hypothetical protein B0J13DRAFT_588949 [Dactylonectria estremocensis]|uniref:DNA 3'-5' helicase n=1 Tax=Dactylonectria estremocensis TaxID=1079267 RepID=A0A9P9IPH9_9HYPO|nr:hypothetical protein B0J13DRAFT_588949 [Dactylonectria estremocensis]